MKNWKSTLAYFVFVSAYIYSILQVKPIVGIVETTGFIALYSSIFMMFRSDFTKDIISKLIDKMSLKK